MAKNRVGNNDTRFAELNISHYSTAVFAKHTCRIERKISLFIASALLRVILCSESHWSVVLKYSDNSEEIRGMWRMPFSEQCVIKFARLLSLFENTEMSIPPYSSWKFVGGR